MSLKYRMAMALLDILENDHMGTGLTAGPFL